MMDVKIYTTPTCGYCHQAKAFFTQIGVPFKEVDVSSDQTAAQEMVDLTGQMGVPVIVMGNEIVIGFDRARIQQILSSGGSSEKPQPNPNPVRLGLKIADAAKKNAGQSGVLVGEVSPGFLGEKAGLKEGDVITGFAGNRINTPEDLTRIVPALQPGNIVSIMFWRGNEQRKSEIVI
jgi:glutaredoxin 3